MKSKLFYEFGEASLKDYLLVGMKGAYLSEMTQLGLPIPEGFTISSEASDIILQQGVSKIKSDLKEYISNLELKTGKKLGDPENPLIVSVRSGAPVSMPGIMDTILNIGVTEDVVKKNPNSFLGDCYKRLILSFVKNVCNANSNIISYINQRNTPEELMKALNEIKKAGYNVDFPAEPESQLEQAINSVFKSWYSKKAQDYRAAEGISKDLKTATNVQRMVFGNKDKDSLTAVLFSRNPMNGKKELFGNYIPQAQGDDLVNGNDSKSISELNESLLSDLKKHAEALEKHYKQVQEMEATVESGNLFLLQTRIGKTTDSAKARILLDFLEEGKITQSQFFKSMTPEILNSLNGKQVDPNFDYHSKVLAKGTPVIPGIALTKFVCNSCGGNRLLVKQRLGPEDVPSINTCDGIIAAEGSGNYVSHAIVIARAKNKPTITGLKLIKDGYWFLNGHSLSCGTEITLNGNTGEIIKGHVPLINAKSNEERKQIEKLIKDACKEMPGQIFLERDINKAKKLIKEEGVMYFSRMYSDRTASFYQALRGNKKELHNLTNIINKEFASLRNTENPLVLAVPSYDFFQNMILQEEQLTAFRNEVVTRVKDLATKVDPTSKELEVNDLMVYENQTVKILKIDSGGNVKVHYLEGNYDDWIAKCELPAKKRVDFKFVESLGIVKTLGLELKRAQSVYQSQRRIAEKNARGKKNIKVMEYNPELKGISINGRNFMIAHPKDDPLLLKLNYLTQNA